MYKREEKEGIVSMFDKLFEKIAFKVVTKKFEENKELLEKFVADLKDKAEARFKKFVDKAKAEINAFLPEKKAEIEKLFEDKRVELLKLLDEKKDKIKEELLAELKDSFEKAKNNDKK